MGNNYHLIIETPDANLSQGMRQLSGMYAQIFKRRHERVRHIFRGRFKGIVVQRNSHLLELSRYVVLNPVRAGMAAIPEQWRWSSYRLTAGLTGGDSSTKCNWILSQFGTTKRAAYRNFRNFVRDGMAQPDSPWEKLKGQLIVGDDEFTASVQELIDRRVEISEIPKLSGTSAVRA
jgi:putative transposase